MLVGELGEGGRGKGKGKRMREGRLERDVGGRNGVRWEMVKEKRGEEGGRYLSNMAIPFLRPNSDFYCFLHEPGGDDDCVDGSLCCAGRHGCLEGAQKLAVVKGRN